MKPTEQVKPVFTQAMADAGELPPVGSYVDIKWKLGNSFVGVEVNYISANVIVYTLKNLKQMYGDMSAIEHIKPIKSKREKAIDEMKLSAASFKGRYVQLNAFEAGKLYDANYRKLTPEHAKMYDDKTHFFGEDYK